VLTVHNPAQQFMVEAVVEALVKKEFPAGVGMPMQRVATE
jgi:hypothetical protein